MGGSDVTVYIMTSLEMCVIVLSHCICSVQLAASKNGPRERAHLHACVSHRAQEALALGGDVRELPLEEVHDGVASVHPVRVLLGDGDGRQGGQQQQEGAHGGGGRERGWNDGPTSLWAASQAGLIYPSLLTPG
ncbi:Protein of unknown function [Gryllus bimaculatus]|nr:Protein of unknown function [Gryllus bimaculatus]